MTTALRLLILTSIFLSAFAGAQTKPAANAPQPPNLEQGIDQMFAAMDKDKNKQINFAEFKAAVVAERKQMVMIEQLRGNFQFLDKNKSNFLELAEFNADPGIQNLPAPKPVLVTYDKNKDGKLDFREYVEFVGKISNALRNK